MNNKIEIYASCKTDPTKIFKYIREGEIDIVNDLLDKNIVNINTVDRLGNDVMTRLLKAHEYDAVLKNIKRRNWSVNHQNIDGNTFGHILAIDNSIYVVKILEALKKKKNYLPNIKNNNGFTALDMSLNNKYLCTSFKLLEDKRFNNIDIYSFKNLFNVSIKNRFYGKYTKINNLEIIVNNLEKKELSSSMKNLVDVIDNNMEVIKDDFMKNHTTLLESIINSYLVNA